MFHIPFSVFNWADVKKVEHKGETGTSFSQTLKFHNLTIHIVEYSANYIAGHWCRKGQFVYCLEGEIFSVHQNSDGFILTKGMSYIVSSNMSVNQVVSVGGATVLIIDDNFLRLV